MTSAPLMTGSPVDLLSSALIRRSVHVRVQRLPDSRSRVHVDVCWVRCARGMEWPFGRGLFVHIRNTLKVRAFFKRIQSSYS